MGCLIKSAKRLFLPQTLPCVNSGMDVCTVLYNTSHYLIGSGLFHLRSRGGGWEWNFYFCWPLLQQKTWLCADQDLQWHLGVIKTIQFKLLCHIKENSMNSDPYIGIFLGTPFRHVLFLLQFPISSIIIFGFRSPLRISNGIVLTQKGLFSTPLYMYTELRCVLKSIILLVHNKSLTKHTSIS